MVNWLQRQPNIFPLPFTGLLEIQPRRSQVDTRPQNISSIYLALVLRFFVRFSPPNIGGTFANSCMVLTSSRNVKFPWHKCVKLTPISLSLLRNTKTSIINGEWTGFIFVDCLHTLLHAAPETTRVGPGTYLTQFTMERAIGDLGGDIQQPSNIYGNFVPDCTPSIPAQCVEIPLARIGS
jgi:hypothetical protein